MQAGVDKHFPDLRASPVVTGLLRPKLDSEVIVSASQHGWCRVELRDWQTHQVLPEPLKGLIPSALVVITLALAIADKSRCVADVD